MLRFHTGTSAYGVKKYFEGSDYYADESVGKWFGKLAGRLGLSGPVEKPDFDQLCDNINPATGKPLTPRTNTNRRIGEDIIFSLPKDVGAFIMLQPPEEREQYLTMVERRVEEVAAMIEEDVQTRVRKRGAFENRPGDGLIIAGFRHTTARPVDGQPPDPHPHWHMFAMNATTDLVESGRIKAADFANIYRDRPYYEAVFFSRVAADFAEMGHAIERRTDGKWGLAGLESLNNTFSKRTHAIEEEARKLNITEPARKAELGGTTRAKKQKTLAPDELQDSWFAQLTDDQRDALAKAQRKEYTPGEAVTAEQAVAYAIEHCSEKHSVVPERELIRFALLRGMGDVTHEEIVAEMPCQGVIVREKDGRRMATTRELQREEEFITALPTDGSVRPVGVPDGLERGELNDGQWETVRGLLSSASRINVVEGAAGTGKSTMLQAYDDAMRQAGQAVTYLATSSDAVEVLRKDGFAAHTVAHFLLDEKMRQKAAGGRVVVDEAGLLGHKDAYKLFQDAQENDLRLNLLGDSRQHGSVSRGALLRLLEQYGGVNPFRLTEIKRQKLARYREIVERLFKGKSADGFDRLDGLGWVRQLSDDERSRTVAADYLESLGEGKSCLVIAPTHREAGQITREIRDRMREAGKLGNDEREFTRLVAVDTSAAERGLATTYRVGDVIQFQQNAPGFTKGDRLVVTDPANLPLQHAARFSLYRPEEIALAEGDIIRFTGTVTTEDGAHKLRNGAVHTIAGFTPGGNIRLDNGWVVEADAGHFRSGFVQTSFGAQGKTVDRVLASMSSYSLPAVNMEHMYVSASRGRERMTLFTDDKDAIRRAIGQSSAKLVALDLADPAPKPRPENRLQRDMAERRRRGVIERIRSAWKTTDPKPVRDLSYGR
jgi:conjugative relaxase-like TrwC/TraI family protein